MKITPILLVALLLTACASNPPARYMKKNASEDEFADVAYQCQMKTSRAISGAVKSAYGDISSGVDAVDCNKFHACMASKGFIKSSNGRFALNGKEIDCKE